MLNKDRMKKILYFILLVVVLMSCDSKEDNDLEIAYGSKIESMFGKHFKQHLYQCASDTLISWVNNNFLIDSAISNSGKPFICNYRLDSTICLNSFGNKLIGTMHLFYFSEDDKIDDGIQEFYGAKIDGNWYFWLGGYMPIMRESFKNHDPSKPLSYAQLHKAAMENFLGGYLTKNGEINEAWFDGYFKGPGWGTFKDRYRYKSILDGQHIDNEKAYWNYLWKKAGLMNWIRKFSNDSIKRVNETLKPEHITREEENEIRSFFTRKLVNGK